MPIRVRCPECDAQERVADDAAGTMVRCGECGARIRVPVDDDRDTAIQPPGAAGRASRRREDDDTGDDDRPIARRKKGGSTGVILAIVGGVLALSCLLCGVVGAVPVVLWWQRPAPKVAVAKAPKDKIDGVVVFKDKVAKDIAIKDAFKDFAKDLVIKDVPFKDIKDVAKVPPPNLDLMKGPPKDFANDFKGGPIGPPIGPPPGGGKVVLNQQARLTPNDPIRDGKSHKPFNIRFEQGRTYVIDMQSVEMDSYLRLYDPNGIMVAQDDDGGGYPNARIVYRANQAGNFTIAATYFGGVRPEGATFLLTVREQ
jgi:predicted Zn finger-like uncharacterized protein